MRRPILGIKNDTSKLVTTPTRVQIELNGLELEKRLRSKRSEAYSQTMNQLDAGGVVCNKQLLDDMLAAVAQEFPDLQPHQYPLGIISKCYLGSPYQVHVLDVSLEIVEHYEVGKSLPGGLERARSLALHPQYLYIEVFSDYICAVSESGSVAVIKG